MKLLKVLVAVLVMAAMAVPVIAEDRLSLSGEMRVRAGHIDGDFDGDTDDSTDTWANQRLRIAGKIAVAEGVSVTFRTDITEGTNWGDSSNFQNGLSGAIGPIRTNGFGHARSGAQQQWDRAHLDITKGIFHLRAGQQYVGTGGTFAVDTQDSGLSLDIAAGLPVNVFMIVDKDGGSTDVQDSFLYGASVKLKPVKVFAAGYNDFDEDVYLLGASGSFDLGAIKLFAEADFFDGDASATQEAFGLQMILDASLAASDAATVGAQFFYAMGDDEDVQYVRLGNGFNGYDPIMDVGTSLSNEEIGLGNPFDWTGDDAGVIGARLYGNVKASDALKFGVSLAYLTVEEDSVTDADIMALAAGMVYTILPNTTFQLQLQYTDGSYDKESGVTVANGDFDVFAAATGLFVKF